MGFTYRWLQVSVCKPFGMHEIKSLQDLNGNLLGLQNREWLAQVLQVLPEVAVLEVLHGNEDGIIGVEPAI